MNKNTLTFLTKVSPKHDFVVSSAIVEKVPNALTMRN
jgi:hypothetical protein